MENSDAPKRKRGRPKKENVSMSQDSTLKGMDQVIKKIEQKKKNSLIADQYTPVKHSEDPVMDPHALAQLEHEINVQFIANERRKILNADFDLVKNYLSEYFDAFVLIGYDVSGNRISIAKEENPFHTDALNDLIKKAFMMRMQNAN